MLKTDSPLVICYEHGDPSDLVISYLYPQNYRHRDYKQDKKNMYLFVKREKLGDKLNLRNCCLWLHLKNPKRNFTHSQIEMCYNIFKIILENATMTDGDPPDDLDVYYSVWHKNVGIFMESRCSVLRGTWNVEMLNIVCYNVDDQESADFAETSKWDLDKRQNDSVAKKYPSFTLMELLDYEWAYKMFCDFWTGLPNHQKCRDVLQEACKMYTTRFLPNDIIDYIYSKVSEPNHI